MLSAVGRGRGVPRRVLRGWVDQEVVLAVALPAPAPKVMVVLWPWTVVVMVTGRFVVMARMPLVRLAGRVVPSVVIVVAVEPFGSSHTSCC